MSGPSYSAASRGIAIPNQSNISQMSWAAALSAVYRSRQPIYDQDIASREDPEAWDKVQRDGVCKHAIEHRLASVARQKWNIEPGGDRDEDKRVAGIVEQIIRRTRGFTRSRRHLAKAIFLGYAPAWIEGDLSWDVFYDGTRPLPAKWWIPTRLRELDKRMVRFMSDPEIVAGGIRPRVRVEMWLPRYTNWKPVEHPESLVIATYDDDPSRLGMGRGLMEALYNLVWIKGVVRREGLEGLERWCQGIVVAKVNAEAHAASDKDTQRVASEFLEALSLMRSSGVLAVDSRDDVQVIRGGEAGQQMAHEWLRYIDAEITQLVLSSTLATGGGGDAGSFARAETESDSMNDVLDGDREWLDEILTESLVRQVYELNRPHFAEFGIGSGRCPRMVSTGTRQEDPKTFLESAKLAMELGMRVSVEEAHRRAGIGRPAPDEEVLKLPQPAPMAPGAFGAGLPDPFGTPSPAASEAPSTAAA